MKGEIIAAQNQALQTKYLRQNYYKQKEVANADSKQFHEIVEHVISPCSALEKEQYIERHDRVCA